MIGINIGISTISIPILPPHITIMITILIMPTSFPFAPSTIHFTSLHKPHLPVPITIDLWIDLLHQTWFRRRVAILILPVALIPPQMRIMMTTFRTFEVICLVVIVICIVVLVVVSIRTLTPSGSVMQRRIASGGIVHCFPVRECRSGIRAVAAVAVILILIVVADACTLVMTLVDAAFVLVTVGVGAAVTFAFTLVLFLEFASVAVDAGVEFVLGIMC